MHFNLATNTTYKSANKLTCVELSSHAYTPYLVVVGVDNIEVAMVFVEGHAQWVLEANIPTLPVKITKCK